MALVMVTCERCEGWGREPDFFTTERQSLVDPCSVLSPRCYTSSGVPLTDRACYQCGGLRWVYSTTHREQQKELGQIYEEEMAALRRKYCQ